MKKDEKKYVFEKECDVDIEGMGRLKVYIVCPTCSSCRHFYPLLTQKEEPQAYRCSKHDKLVSPNGAQCEYFE